ncbi:MAG: amidohydrolase family protein [Actinomycetes bacterium]|jgi:predicted TIM-barrel fold metal-dependent hydrolase
MSELLPIIDTHIHLWDTKHPELKWVWLDKDAIHPILGNIDAIKSVAFTLNDLWSEARFSGISGFVHIQAAIGSPDPVTETTWLAEMAKTGPIPMRIVGDANLNSEDSISQLQRHQESNLFVGVRDFNAEPMFAAKTTLPNYENSLKYMAKESLVFDMDCEWQNMAEALKLAQRHPELPIVLEHIGFPRKRDDEYFRNWKSAINNLAQAPNVTMKISGVGMTDPGFTRESLRKWAESSLEAFGPDRTVLGSNWPVDRLFVSYATMMEFTRDYIATLSSSEQEKVCSGNAAKLYKF